MSRSAVKRYCELQLTNIMHPVMCTVATYKPKVTTVGEERAFIYIEDPETEETPLVLGIGPTTQQVEHKVRFEIDWITPDEEKGAKTFDTLMEVIDGIFRGTQTRQQIVITDEETGAESIITEIGKRITTHMGSAELDEEPQGMVIFSADKTMIVKEVLTS